VKDVFAPFRQGNYLSLPAHVQVHMILTEKDCQKIDLLVGQPYVGADAEWRCQVVNAFSNQGNKGPALFQLSSENDAVLIDLIGLKNNQILDQALYRLFNHPNTVIVGFSFSSDLSMFKEHLPEMKFYQTIANLCDILDLQKALNPEDGKGGLTSVCL
jgi:hypothetical protein